MSVSCPFGNLTVTATPVAGVEQNPTVPVDQDLTLSVNLTEGSFAKFEILWGDEMNISNDDFKDKMVRYRPFSFLKRALQDIIQYF